MDLEGYNDGLKMLDVMIFVLIVIVLIVWAITKGNSIEEEGKDVGKRKKHNRKND